MSCASTTAPSPAASTSSPSPGGAPTTDHCANLGPAAALPSARIAGVHGTSPTPMSLGSSAAAWTGSATSASRSTVFSSKTWRGVTTQPERRARDASCIDMIESPPSSKKLSSALTRSTPRTSANSALSSSSAAPAGARPAARSAKSGAGSAALSSFPFTVSGRASRTVTAAGTMYSGSRPATCSRRVVGSEAGSGGEGGSGARRSLGAFSPPGAR